MYQKADLPPGQREIDTLPRFGLPKFANRFPSETREIAVDVGGDVRQPARLSSPFSTLARVEQVSDFHCVTTWTKRNVRWSGFRFSDFYHDVVLSRASPKPDATLVVLRGQDGYRVGLPLGDLLAPDVLLADRMDGKSLTIANGAPLRLVAPAHYGYKSAKHISALNFVTKARGYREAGFEFMDHPRARVQFEERGRVLPGWIFRWLYRPLITPMKRKFRQALTAHMAEQDGANGC